MINSFLRKVPIARYFFDIQDRLIHIEDKINILGETSFHKRNFEEEIEVQSYKENETLKIAYYEGGGLGDCVLDTQIIKAISMLNPQKIEIDFYCTHFSIFKKYPFIRNAYPYEKKVSGYDLVLVGHRIVIIQEINKTKVKSFSPELYNWCIDSDKLLKNEFRGQLFDWLFTNYALLHNKNRIEQGDIKGILGFDRHTPTYMPLDSKEFDILRKYNLFSAPYIVINRGVDGKYNLSHPKLWTMESYAQLTKRLKEAFPDIQIVQLGADDVFGRIPFVDQDLLGKTNLEQTKIILKHACLFISSEGGLVHINHFLHGKSVVIFGPTLPEIFGYEENKNIRGTGCNFFCENLVESWRYKCPRGFSTPPCIDSVSADNVFAAVSELLKDTDTFNFQVRSFDNYDTNQVLQNLENSDKICFIGEPLVATSKKYDSFVETPLTPSQIESGYQYGSPYNIPAKDGTYDLCVCDILPNKQNVYFCIKEMLRVIKPTGAAVCKVYKPNIPETIRALEALGMEIAVSDKNLKFEMLLIIKKSQKENHEK